MPDLHPNIKGLLVFFEYKHLPENLKRISAECYTLAYFMVENITSEGAELTAGLRKLLEAKDCFVRAAIAKSLEED